MGDPRTKSMPANPGVCPLCASHAEIERLRVAAEKLHAFVNAKGQEHEDAARGRVNTQSKTYDEERALVCWQILDEVEALFQGAGEQDDATKCWCGSTWPCMRPERHIEVKPGMHPHGAEGEPLRPLSEVQSAIDDIEERGPGLGSSHPSSVEGDDGYERAAVEAYGYECAAEEAKAALAHARRGLGL